MPTTGTPTSRDLLLVALGGTVGAAGRWAIVEATSGPDGAVAGPVLLVNLVGCGLLGLLLGHGVGRSAHRLLGAGLCGGLTTFSTFAVEVAVGLRDGDTYGAVAYALLSVFGGLAALALGRQVGRVTAAGTS